MKSRSGFTLIEVVIVVAVISILATMVTFAYTRHLATSNDARRAADLKTLAGFLDTYHIETGNYPVTCQLPNSNVNPLQSSSGCANTISFYTSAGLNLVDMIPAGASTATLKNIFPGINKDLRDPKDKDGAPQLNHIVSGSVAPYSYYLFSPDLVYDTDPTGTQSFSSPGGPTITCSYKLHVPSSSEPWLPQQYVIGFYSEVANSWYFGISANLANVATITWEPANASSGACTPHDIY